METLSIQVTKWGILSMVPAIYRPLKTDLPPPRNNLKAFLKHLESGSLQRLHCSAILLTSSQRQ